MIRINLLGVPKAKKARRGPAISLGGGVNMTLIGVIVGRGPRRQLVLLQPVDQRVAETAE